MRYTRSSGAAALLLWLALPPALAGQERPLGQELERGERARVEREIEHQQRMQERLDERRRDGMEEHARRLQEYSRHLEQHARRLQERAEQGAYLYRYSAARPCGRMGIDFVDDGDAIVVRDVTADYPAERAGVLSGDTIVRVDDRPASEEYLLAFARRIAPGDTVRLLLRRDGTTRQVAVVAQEDACTLRQVLTRQPFTVCVATDSAGRTEQECETADFEPFIAAWDSSMSAMKLDLRRLHDSLPRFRVESADSGVWLRFRQGDLQVPSESLFIELDSVRIFTDRALSLADSVRGLPVIVAMRDSLATILPRLHELRRLGADEAEHAHRLGEEARAHSIMVRNLTLGHRAIAGAEVQQLNPSLGQYFDVEAGVLVTDVAADTPADDAGLQPGDVIVAVNAHAVRDVETLRREIARRPDDGTVLDVVRRGERQRIRLPD